MVGKTIGYCKAPDGIGQGGASVRHTELRTPLYLMVKPGF